MKGTLYAVVITLVLVLVVALVIRLTGIGGVAITVTSQIIKVLSIFIGVAIALRGIEKRGFIFGGIIGILYTAFAFLVFSIIDSSFDLTAGLLTDALFATVVGVLSAFLLRAAGRSRASY